MYEEKRHERLIEAEWDEARAHQAIDQIVQDAHAHFDPQKLWPIHPLDQINDNIREPFKMLYFGAAGVIWALHYLNEIGATKLKRDYSRVLTELAAKNRIDLKLSAPDRFSYLMGDVGILLVQWRLFPGDALAGAIFRTVAANANNSARELMWGAPGTMLAALFMYESTAEPHWKEAYLHSAQNLLDTWKKNPALDCFVWTQNLYGQINLYLGAVHGFAANVFTLLKGRPFLDSRTIGLIESRAAQTLARTATADQKYANWAPVLGGTRHLVQFCHGAPGMIVCLAGLPSDEESALYQLMIKGGELIWKAGPLTKGSNLCHGTAGNGYAFLKLYRRTKNPKWLERARAFATHAIAQTERDLKKYGHFRYSLWTGDLGLAAYLWDCIRAEANFPTMDVF
ncbi:MAG: lanthionine synthetase C family protein [Chloroflexota bacterium]